MPRRRYRTFSSYLQQRFGEPVRKLSLDAGFTCPNRDGTFSDVGCSYCAPETFSLHSHPNRPSLIQQIRQGIDAGHRRGIHCFIAYFQAYTNTYAPVAKLKDIYDIIRAFPEIVGISIGTRPDCIDEEKLELINSYTSNYDVWIEYGLQSIHDETLFRINRGHNAEAFFRAIGLTRHYSEIKICVHVILGLPGESPAMELETARRVAQIKPEGIKIHPLHVVMGTTLAQDYQQQNYQPLTLTGYVERVVHFLELLWPETVVQRLSADSLGSKLLAPQWLLEKNAVLQAIQTKLEQEDSWQGKFYS